MSVKTSWFYYTTAPEAYDYPQVVEAEPTKYEDSRGRPIRRLCIDDEIMGGVKAQMGRNGSGLHPTWNANEFAQMLYDGDSLIREAGSK